MNSSPKKRPILGIITLVYSLIVVLCSILFKVFALTLNEKDAIAYASFWTLIMVPIGIIIGLVALFIRGNRILGLAGLVICSLSLAVDAFFILKYLLNGIMTGISAVR